MIAVLVVYIFYVLALQFIDGASSLYKDGLDPTIADNTFHVECGNNTDNERIMRIMFRGDAFGIYSSKDPKSCVGKEVENAHFQIENAMTDTSCKVQKLPGMMVYFLEIVVKGYNVRHFDDGVYVITCNYELGGVGRTMSKQIWEGAIMKVPELRNAGGLAENSVSLEVVGTRSSTPLNKIKLGSYIQLKANMNLTSSNEEYAFKMWNCRAYSGQDQYYLMVAGCGDGDVVKKNRGWLSTYNGTTSEAAAKSVFFRAFKLPNADTLTFECNFIVCLNASCVGRSCIEPVRRKRSTKDSTAIKVYGDNAENSVMAYDDQDFMFNMGLPVTTSTTITILPDNKNFKLIKSKDSPKHVQYEHEGEDYEYSDHKPEVEIMSVESSANHALLQDYRMDQLIIGFASSLVVLALVMFGLAVSITGVRRTLNNKLAHFPSKSCEWKAHGNKM